MAQLYSFTLQLQTTIATLQDAWLYTQGHAYRRSGSFRAQNISPVKFSRGFTFVAKTTRRKLVYVEFLYCPHNDTHQFTYEHEKYSRSTRPKLPSHLQMQCTAEQQWQWQHQPGHPQGPLHR